MANTITLTVTPDGHYWIRVLDDDIREVVRQLLGPFRHGNVFRNLLLIGLKDEEAEYLILDAQQSRKATIRGITPKAAFLDGVGGPN